MNVVLDRTHNRDAGFLYSVLTANSNAVSINIHRRGVKHQIIVMYYTFVIYSLLFTLRGVLSVYNFTIKKNIQQVKRNLKKMAYHNVRKTYDSPTTTIRSLTELLQQIEKLKDKPAFRRTYFKVQTKVQKALTLSNELQDVCATVLFEKVNSNNPFNEKDSQTFKSLEDFWGDDSDEVYAQNTHSALVKKL